MSSSTSKFTSLSLNDIPFPAFSIDNSGCFDAINTFAENLTGYKEYELLGQPVEKLIANTLVETHELYRKNHIRNSGAMSGNRNIEILTKYKELIKGSIRLSETEQGYIAFFNNNANLSDKPRYSSSNSAQKVLNAIEQPFWEWDIEQDLMYYSAQLMSLLGYKKEAFTGPRSFWEKNIPPEDLDEIYRKVDDHIAGNTTSINATYSLKTEQGGNKWVNIIGKVLEYKNDKPYKLFGSMKDITQSHLLIDQLKEQNNYLMLAEKLSRSGHWRVDLVTNNLFWSTGVYHIHGVDALNYTPSLDKAINLYIESDRELVREHIENAVNHSKGFYFKSTIVQPNGEKTKIECLGEVEVNDKGKTTGIFGVFKDISKSEEVFEKLKLLAMVNYTIKVPIFFIDDFDNVVYQDLSPQLGNKNSVLFNYINFTITQYLEFKKKAKELGQIKKNSISFDKYISVFDLSITYAADNGIYIWIVENVTDKFRKDQQQVISNRLALLGNTFGNVSHDINNVLGVALGATEMLEIKYSQGERDISNYIERVKNAIDKGKSVTERLLAFTKKPTIKVVKFDPIHEIEENKHLFMQLLLPTIDLSLELEKLNCEINFPQGEFINILLNLVLNAQDAIRENGLIGKIVITANINEGGELEIHIKDSGIGIAQENLSRIFDPFYSSKSVNKGNGIGLANVYSTVYKHNGSIQVAGKCELGGAHFTLIFKCRQVTDKTRSIKATGEELNLKEHSILILDDEESIAEFVALFLESQGALTTHVTTKNELLQKLQTDQHYDIFITDMILPDISGREAVENVLKKFPEIKVYSISGYIAEEDRNWEYPVLRKPFNSKELAKFLQE